MSRITTHVLDTSRGRPADGVKVTLCRMQVDRWEIVARGQTNADGRVGDWAAATEVPGNEGGDDPGKGAGNVPGSGTGNVSGSGAGNVPGNGIYIIRFETKDYFDMWGVASFYPFVEVYFEVTTEGHYHIPLLLSPYGYSTYRGS